jgi:hypothetical protein
MTDTEHTQSTTEGPSIEETSSPEVAQPTQRNPEGAGTPPLADKTALLHELVATIRAAVAPGVTPEARAAGAAACRAILTALEAQVGHSLVPTTSQPTATRVTQEPTSPLGRILSQLVGMPREQFTGLLSQLAAMPREQLLDFLINRLRSALPPGTQTRVSAGPRFHLIQIPQAPPVGKTP